MQLNVNTQAVRNYSKKLEKISRSALPVAIRESLNDSAKDMKTNTLLRSSKDKFINRSLNFFKANSSFDKAEGFNVGSMKATVGMMETGLKGRNNYAVKDLVQQETGGDISNKTLIPTPEARVGNQPNKLVRPNARLQQIKNAVKAGRGRGVSKGQKFVLAAIKAGAGGFVISSATTGKTMLWKITSVFSSLKTKGTVIKAIPLYSVRKGRHVHVKAHHFIEDAGDKTHKKIDDFFIERARRAIAKIL